MFLDLNDYPPPPPWEPQPEPPASRLTARQQRTLALLIGVNVLLLLAAPIGGATLIAALWALLH
jgi:hypothetical protein